MADFAAVLRKTIATLAENTPEARDRIYQKARSTIEAKLKAVSPPPPQHVVDRQMKVLEDAIAEVEAEYAPPAPAEDRLDGLDEVLRDLEALSREPSNASWSTTENPATAPAPPVAANAPAPKAPEPVATQPKAEPVAAAKPTSPEPVVDEPSDEVTDEPELDTEDAHDDNFDDLVHRVDEPVQAQPARKAEVEAPKAKKPADDEIHLDVKRPPAPAKKANAAADPVLDALHERPALRELRERKAKRSLKKPLLAAAAVLLICAVAAGGWFYRDQVMELAGGSGSDEVAADSSTPAETVAAAADQNATAQSASQSAQQRKLTQRLLPDGSEVDEGPASENPTLGEGTSIAASSERVAAAGPQETNSEPAGNNQPAVAVGQKAIFYEERTIQEQASASDGNVVWSIQQESPGADLPPEPVIYAEATIPSKRMRLKMSIRRNVDQSLPASYIAELIFLTPEDFPGGAVGSVASVSLKRTEQDAGNRLLGVPAKIADGFFLVALSDNKADVEANNLLLGRMEWIDIPIVYTSGRRALITLEKGVPGSAVFNDAVNAWKQAMSG